MGRIAEATSLALRHRLNQVTAYELLALVASSFKWVEASSLKGMVAASSLE